MKNSFNLLVLIGIVFACLGVCCLTMIAQDVLDASWKGEAFRWGARQTLYLGSGIMGVVSGVGLMLRMPWARLPATLLVILAGGAWTLAAVNVIKIDERSFVLIIGISLFVYSSCLFAALFLNNQYTLKHFDPHGPDTEGDERILDL